MGQIVLGQEIRACTGSFDNVYPGTSPLYISVGQDIGVVKKMGHGYLVDAQTRLRIWVMNSTHATGSS